MDFSRCSQTRFGRFKHRYMIDRGGVQQTELPGILSYSQEVKSFAQELAEETGNGTNTQGAAVQYSSIPGFIFDRPSLQYAVLYGGVRLRFSHAIRFRQIHFSQLVDFKRYQSLYGHRKKREEIAGVGGQW